MTDLPETRIETYIPLYRKYRPQAFADVVGQEAIVQTLGNAIQLNKVAHAYLFCGPRGTGKTSTARIFAKSLNCENGPTVTPCLQCASCTGIAQGNALDVIEFDAASNNGVGDARELIENCQYSSMTGRFKVYIIDEVHMLTPQAFNALLKTLEEPPPNVIFIFATTEAHKVLPTIISRCQRFDFNRITTDSIINRLRYIASAESITIDEEALLMIARHARGGLRDAVGLLDQVAVLGRANPGKEISRKDVALFIGTLEEELLLRLSRAIAERRAADLLNDLNELMSRGIEPIQLLKDLTVHFRNLLLVQAAGPQANPDALSLPADYFNALAEQAGLFPEPEELPQIIGRLSFVERNIRNGTQPQLWLEVGLIELAYRHEIHQVKALTERVASLEAMLSGGAPVLPQGRASAPQATHPQSASPSFSPQAMPVQPNQTSINPVQQPAMGQPAQLTAAHSAGYASQPAVGGMAASHPAHGIPASNPAQGMSPASNPVVPIGDVLPQAAPAAAQQPKLGLGVGSGSVETDYRQICATVPNLNLRSLLQQQAFPLSFAGDVLTIGVLSEPNMMVMKKPERFIHLQKSVDKYYGREIRIDLVVEKNRPVGSMPPPVAAAAPRTAISPPPAAPAAEFSNPVAPAAPISSSSMPISTPAMPMSGASAPVSPEAGTSTTTTAVLERPEIASALSHSAMPAMSPQALTSNGSALAHNTGQTTGQTTDLMPSATVMGVASPLQSGAAEMGSGEPGARKPAMAALPDEPPPLVFNKPPVSAAIGIGDDALPMAVKVSSGSANVVPAGMDDDAPPMDSGFPPPNLDEDDDYPPMQAPTQAEPVDFSVLASAGSDPELLEAKKHALELLQGKVLD